ncbi:MAG: hypothetical protein OEZ36_10145 [Spirochaetota bacterium]|nr:hypothetical protein [Spirochaetota bacterium]
MFKKALNKTTLLIFLMILNLSFLGHVSYSQVTDTAAEESLVDSKPAEAKEEKSESDSKIKYAAVEFNFGPWVGLTWGPSIDVDYNFGSLSSIVNGLNFHASFVIHTNPAPFDALLDAFGQAGAVKLGGFGGSAGVRYFFGDTGVDGFYLGVKSIFGSLDIIANTTNTTGIINIPYSGYAVDLGKRYMLMDIMVINVGAGFGQMFASSASGSIINSTTGAVDFAATDVTGFIGFLPWFEFILSVGVAF